MFHIVSQERWMSSNLQQQFVQIQKVRRTDGKNYLIKYISNNYGYWGSPMTAYQYFYITPALPPQNLFFQQTPSNIIEIKEPLVEKRASAQPNIQRVGDIATFQDVCHQIKTQHCKTVSSLVLQNSKKMKKDMKNHNVLPNIMNTLLSYIRRRNKTVKIVERIINKIKNFSQNFNANRYYAYEIYLHSKIPKSKHENSLRFIVNHIDQDLAVFSIEEQVFYNKICRILICQLLNQQFMLSFLTNKKCVKTSRPDHLKAKRFIIAILKEGIKTEQYINSL